MGPDVDRDHVVPDSFFPPSDRSNFPLLLKTHASCNRGHSPFDQKFAELFKLYWDPKPEMNLQRLQLEWQVDQSGRATHSMWRHDDLPAMVFDWIRGFHYALYGEFLPLASHRATLLPFRELRADGTEPDLRQFFGFADFLLRQRVLSHFDRIYAYNGRLKYECAWYIDKGKPTCAYALDVNGWSIFSDPAAGGLRCAIGVYVTRMVPGNATPGSRLIFSGDPLTLDLFPENRERYMRGNREMIRKTVS
jgi:hypothetical protein